ncbi:amino acid adenylation domain-containing protein [Luteibacter sp. PPL552]
MIEEYVAPAPVPADGPALVVLSARDEERLRERVRQLVDHLAVLPPTVTLHDLAYTLQVGREAMDERLGLLVHSLDQLRDTLAAWLEDKPVAEGVYRGQARRGKEALATLAADDDMAATVDAWLDKGKYGRVLDLWTKGLGFDWHRLHAPGERQRVSLPTYPFARERYWLPIETHDTPPSLPPRPTPGDEPTSEPSAVLAFEPLWTAQPVQAAGETLAFASRHVCLSGWPVHVGENLQIAGAILSSSPDDADHARAYEAAALHLLDRLQQVAAQPGHHLVQVVVPTDHRFMAGLAGMLRTAALENTRLTTQWIAVTRADEIALACEENAGEGNIVVRYAGAGRHVAGWTEQRDPVTGVTPWKDHGVYLITGGAGGLGLIVARAIAGAVRHPVLILTGRSAMNDAIKGHVRQLEALGAVVRYHALDVADTAAVNHLVGSIPEEFESLDGIVHSAGVVRDSFLAAKTPDQLRDVFRAKVAGTLHLDEASRDIPLDVFVCFASIAGALGSVGQADYAAANAFMDAFAHDRAQRVARGERHGRTLSIDWPLWAEGGMQVDDATRTMMRQHLGMHPLSTDDGLRALDQALSTAAAQVLVVAGEASRIRDNVKGVSGPSAAAVAATPPTASPSVPVDAHVRQTLAELVCALIKVRPEDLDGDTTFNEYGFDSVSLTEFGNALNQRYGLRLTPTVFFEYPSLDRLAAYLVQTHASAVVPSVAVVEATPPPMVHVALGRPVDEPIAVIGMSGQFPQAPDLDAFWDNLREGRDCIGDVPASRWDWRGEPGDHARWGGFIDGIDVFDPLFFGISTREAELLDPQQRLMMVHVWKALEDAGYAASALAGSDTAIYVGTGATGYGTLVQRAGLAGEAHASTGGVPSVGPNRISFLFDWHGPSEPVETACSSSLVALRRGVEALRRGDASLAVVGGVNTIVTPDAHASFGKAGMLSPDGRCKTFSADANGYVRGEGVAMLVLKPLSAAERDGDLIHGLVRAVAENHGGHANSLTAPNPTAQADVIRKALAEAGVDPATIGYVEAHGTGTRLGDPVEVQGLKAAFGPSQATGYCGLGSVKTQIGHLELAAGVAGVVKVLLQMKHRTLVKSLHGERINPYVDIEGSPFYLLGESREWTPLRDAAGRALPRRAGVSSFGFGGVNAHAVLEEYVPAPVAATVFNAPALVVLSARHEARLRDQARALLAFVSDREVALHDLAYTLQVGREAMTHRLGFVAQTIDDLRQTLSRLVETDDTAGVIRGVAPRTPAGATDQTPQTPTQWLERWVNGGSVDWVARYGATRPRRIRLPTYPFARDRYWVPTPAAAPGESPVSPGETWTLTPTWEVAPIGSLDPLPSGRIAVIGGTPARREAMSRAMPNASILNLPRDADIQDIQARLRAHGTIDHLVWIVDEATASDDDAWPAAQRDGVLRAFRLAKALLALGAGESALGWTVVTTQAQAVHASDAVWPGHAGVHGFLGAMAREIPAWRIRLIDMPVAGDWPVASLLRLPVRSGETTAWRGGQWFRQGLSHVGSHDGATPPPYREGGVYVVIGGAGGIGQAWSAHLIRTRQAQVVWIGRRPEDEAIAQARASLGQLGPMPHYIVADASDRQALTRARDEVLARFGPIHGVVHAALSLLDRGVVQMDEARLLAGLSAKVDASMCMGQVFGDLPLDFMLFFSSLVSVMRSAGQAAYAAGCCFKDAYARQLGQRLPYPVKLMQWGYWGNVGAVASADYRERMARQGIGSIEPVEGMQAVERLLASPLPQMAFLKTLASDMKADVFDRVGDATVEVLPASRPACILPERRIAFAGDAQRLAIEADEIDRLALAILRGELQALGLHDADTAAAWHPRHARWLRHSMQRIAGIPTSPPLDRAWADWRARKVEWTAEGHVRRAQVTLVDTMLSALPAILQGHVDATAVMFPASSMHLVEGVYRGNAVADHFNDVLCGAVIDAVAARLRRDPTARLRIVEIGAGTGGTAAHLLERLKPYAAHIDEYAYTDLSRAFLHHAEQRFGADHPFLACRLLDIGRPLAEQGMAPGRYDLAVATNVLHATRDIRESLRNAKALLSIHGLLVLNELSRCDLWAHLTFGLLDGWWLYEDEALRIPGCPSLAPERWAAVLGEEGYRRIRFPAAAAHDLGQQVIVAESDGVIRQRRPVAAVAPVPPPAAPVVFAPAPVSASLRDACRARLGMLIARSLKMAPSAIDTATGLDRYGLDSILVQELTAALRTALADVGIGDVVSATLFFEYPTIDALADHLIETAPSAIARWLGVDAGAAVPRPPHPLLHRERSPGVFESALRGDAFVLADHRVQGRRVLPGVAQLEMALAAAPDGQAVSLAQVAWLRPVVAGDDGVTLRLVVGEGAYTLRGVDDVVHSQGRMIPAAVRPVVARHDIAGLRARCAVAHASHERCYDLFARKGLHYGPTFRGLDELFIGTGQVLARIVLPATAPLDGYTLPPSLLDAALQASLGLYLRVADDDVPLALPFAVDAVDVFAPCQPRMWAVVRDSDGRPADGGIRTVDIDLCDDGGQVCVCLRQLSLRRFDPPPTRDTPTDRDHDDMNDSTGIHAEGHERATPSSFATNALRDKGILHVRKLMSRTLSLPLEAIEPGIGFDEYGIDSIAAMDLTQALRGVFGSERIGTTLFFEHSDIEGLVDHLAQIDAEALARWAGAVAETPTAVPVDTPPPVRVGAPVEPAVQRVASTVASAPAAPVTFEVAVVGVSGRYPGANDVRGFWDNLAAGRASVREVPADRWDHASFFDARKGEPGKTYTRWAGLLDDVQGFDRLFFHIAPREAQLMSPQERLFMQEVYAGIEDAGYTPGNLCASRKVGVFVGVTNEHYATGTRFWSIANRISHFCHFQGPSMAVDTACSSSLTAIHLAVESLRGGDSEVAIAGGVNLIVAPTQLIDLASMGMLSEGDRCRSFGAGGDGFVDAEAVGALVLKPLHRAVADGDHIYGVIKGSAINAGGKTNAYLVPNPHMQAQLVGDALRRAGIDARTVSYVEAQGTGSLLGDPIEVAGLSRAFRQSTKDRQFCALGSAKSNVGHSESASGFVAVSKVLMQMKHGMLAPSLHAETPHPEIRFADTPFFVQTTLSPWRRPVLEVDGQRQEYPRRAGISSFGAGGANAHLVIEEYVAPEREAREGAALIVLSARDEDRLRERARQLAGYLAAETQADGVVTPLHDLAYTLQVGREPMEERLALRVESADELRVALDAFVQGHTDIDGLYRGQAKRTTYAMLNDDEDMQVAVQAWVAKGKFGKLLDLWVKGFAFDWNVLYAGTARPHRVSLPTYPFARERCWTDVRYPDAAAPPPPVASEDTSDEAIMIGLWKALLGRPSVSLDDDFFDLGGHSLLATQLAARIRDAFGVDVAVGAMLEAPTVARLVAHVRALQAAAPAPVVPTEAAPAIGEVFPLSFAQQRLWFLDQLEGQSPTYNIPAAVRLKGRVDVAALQAALDDVVRRHDALRARFDSVDGSPVQRIVDEVRLPLVLHDLSGFAPKERDAKTRWLMLDEARTPFDLKHGTLIRSSLLKLSAEEHLLLLTMHHIASDGWSMGLLVRDLGALYAAHGFGAPVSLPTLPMRYVDFARWQREWLGDGVLDRQLAYWTKQLAGSPGLLALPTDRPRPAVQGQDGAMLHYAVPAALTAKLQAFSRRSQCTLFMTLCAAFNVLLARYAGQDDICIGTPIANRNRSEIEDLIGFFVNTLVLRTRVDLRASFDDLLRQVRATTLDAYAHQDVPFEQLVNAVQPERHASHTPLFQVMLVLQNAPLDLALPGLELELLPYETVTAKFDITLSLMESPQGGLKGYFEYNTDLFDLATVQRMADHFTRLLEAAVSEPGRAIGELPMLGEAERRQLLYDFNDTARTYPRVGPHTNTLHTLFEAQVARSPHHTAVVYGDTSLTYAQLNAQANRLARHLRTLGVGPDGLVGLCVERSLAMIVGLYAILKAGGAYVPLDPTYPPDRLATIVADAAPAAILTQRHLREVAPVMAGVPVVDLDDDAALWAAQDDGDLANATGPGHLAYVIYTSGSTGKPKGVGIEHRGIVNRLQWMQEAYPLGADDRVLQKTPFSFDVSVWEFFWPLLEGATLVVARPGGHQDVSYLADLIDAQAITTLHFVPPMLDVFLNEVEPGCGRSLRQVMCSGQALPMELQQRFFATWDHVALHNLYGPTEASVDVTYWPCRKDSGLHCVPIGLPIANIQIHILDDALQPVPVGVVGHLYIAGVGLARGYVNRPELTEQVFVPNPFSAEPGARMYRSGDLARYLPGGVIEYLGRSDHQVKIRGLRIELGEIESTLAAIDGVRDVVVLARPDERTIPRLVAYLVPDDGRTLPESSALRRTLAQTLPDYMVPEHIVALSAMPLTANGKVDRKALPAPETTHDAPGQVVAPRTTTERTIAAVWSDLLKVERIGVTDDFFELGGHSLLATQLVSQLRKRNLPDVELRDLFAYPTLEALAAYVDGRSAPAAPSPTSAASAPIPEEVFPLSFAQQRLWVLDQLEGQSPTYNIPSAVRLKGHLDTAALQAALHGITRRHDALRARFDSVDGSPVQRIAADVPLPLVPHDLTGFSPKEREAKTRWLMSEEARTPFDLRQGPLVRARLLMLSAHEHLLLLTMHHIVSDGWSMGLVVRDLGAMYAGLRAGTPPGLPELPMRYVDYARRQRDALEGEALDAQLAYWTRQLAGIPSLLTLPTDRPRPAVQRQEGAARAFALPVELSAALQSLSRRSQCTLFMTLCAAFNVLLARYAGQDDICIGTPIAGRNQAEIEDLVGFFINTLVLRTQVDRRGSFDDLLKQVRATTLDAYAHQDVPFEQLVNAVQPERHASHTPLFQVMLVLQNAPLDLALPGLELELVPHETVTAKFDLTLSLKEGPHGLHGYFEYNTDLFDPATIERMAGHFTQLLKGIAADPGRPVGELPMLGDVERRRLLHGFNDTARTFPRVGPRTPTVHQLFEDQVRRSADRTAIVFGDASLTYAELNAQANRLARHLRVLGVGPDVLVGLCAERSLEMVVGLYGILKAGGAYVPLDPSYPRDRLTAIVEDAAPVAILTQRHLRHVAPTLPGVPVVDLDEPGRWAGQGDHDLDHATGPDHLAYVIYTSGSTGKPKGVAIEHRGIVNRLQWMQETYPLHADDRVLQKTPFSFDVSVGEFFGAPLEGATLVMARPGGHQDVAYLADVIDAQRVTVAHFVPPMLDVFLNELDAGRARTLRRVLCSGQALSMELQQRVFDAWDHVELLNLYGPTEASVEVTHWPCRRDSGLASVPIGMPIANIQIHILDDVLQPVPVGVVGHLYIAGVGLARGYVNRPDLTEQAFVPNPFSTVPGARMYRSGDLARYLPDGAIEYLGRSDHQVKIRGLRIELGEIESTLAAIDAVRDAVVLAVPDERRVPRLVAYLVPHDGQALPDGAALRHTLSQTLPDYMLPEHVVVLPAMPLTANGKVDRKALPAPDTTGPAAEHVAPRTPTERALATLWTELLHVERVGATDDFFHLGGHSLLATQLVSQLRKRQIADIELRDLFTHATLASLASFIDARQGTVAHPNLVPIRPKGRLAPLFLIHPIGGGVQYAFDLAPYLDPEQPVYGLAIGESVPVSIGAMARTYLEAMRQVQPSGPYAVAGWSLGGMVAYDIAHRLQAAGESVRFVGLIDTSSPAVRTRLTAEHPVRSDDCRALLNWLLDINAGAADHALHPDYPELSRLAGNGDLDALIAGCRHAGFLPEHFDTTDVKRFVDIYRTSGKAGDDYLPPAARVPVTYFAAERREGEDVSLGWHDLVGAHLDVVRIGGTHTSIVRPPLADRLARELSRRLRHDAATAHRTAITP